jgi:ubiquinone/menaquinone biosynthesis C-methylase UbiE
LLDGLASQEERRVLELSPGTGLDIQALPEDLDFYGVDADPSKLQRSRHNLSRSGRTARLFCADASHLPFLDESFDAVLHGGDLRLSPEPCRVLDEMIRVARPGSVVSVIDRADPNIKPRLWVPAAMSEIELVFSPSNTLYRLSFRRP